MNSRQTVDFLIEKMHAPYIYHANSVSTANSLLKLGGLASRHYVNVKGLAQTNQFTDELDKKLDVWNDIFTDSVDIHERISDRNK